MKSISVIIPAYNCESYIERCLASLFSQTGARLDIIAVNDGSTDNTHEILERYSPRIKVISVENGGAAHARSIGLERAEGDFVMFIDSDDYLAEGAVKRLIEKQSETDADIVRFRYENVYKDGSTYIPQYQPSREMLVEKSHFPEIVYPMFMSGIKLNSVCFSMFKQKTVHGLRFKTDMTVAEDAVFSLHAFTRAESVLFLPDVLYEYYQTGTGLTGSAVSVVKKYADNYRFAFETIGFLKKWGMDTLPNRCRTLMRPIKLTFDKIKRMNQKG